ncbi:MAG TPA: hypothetical protein IAB98_08470 [Candidatus Egerieimonas intestinavium]|uniref:Uncharacterized protein n=1 Tax=Candidatus Egerieimonas intestinavium TaxID=2840777 RepID=A0A9D1EKT4_9FIRM|nr:hypothetical protein [Candidatus Egerieimonas intestinavium]
MEEDQKPMTPLDRMVTPDQLQMMKAAIPFLPPQGQRLLSAYAKFTELSNTLQLFAGARPEMHAMAAPVPSPSMSELVQALRPYAPPDFQESLDSLIQTASAVSMFQACSDFPEQMPPDCQEVSHEPEL